MANEVLTNEDLLKFAQGVTHAVQTTRAGTATIEVDRGPAIAAAKKIIKDLRGRSKTEDEPKKRPGRPITRNTRKAEATRKRVALYRAIKRGE